MTAYPFRPQALRNFQFQPTLDGQPYNVLVPWNLFGQRYYIEIYTLQGDLVVSLPLIGSPDWANVSMTAGYFASTMIYRPSTGNFEVSP